MAALQLIVKQLYTTGPTNIVYEQKWWYPASTYVLDYFLHTPIAEQLSHRVAEALASRTAYYQAS